jgi:uncharacterized protein (DUF2141 family)
MKFLNCSKIFILVLSFVFVVTVFAAAQERGYKLAGTVAITESGNIMMALNNREEFTKNLPARFSQTIKVTSADLQQGRVSFAFEDVPEGTYAIQCYQDTNGNGRLDMFLGVPKEPWGTYKRKRPRFRGPKFNEIAFNVKQDLTDIYFKVEK